jgi:hypothetical protein
MNSISTYIWSNLGKSTRKTPIKIGVSKAEKVGKSDFVRWAMMTLDAIVPKMMPVVVINKIKCWPDKMEEFGD